MPLRPSEVAEVVAELRERLVGAPIQKAFAPMSTLVYLELRIPGRTVLVCLSVEAPVARISVAARRAPAPAQPATFQGWLRRELVGGRLARLDRLSPRVVSLEVEHPAQASRRVLVAELTGPSGNLVLTSGEGRVLAMAEAPRTGRALMVGYPYVPPADVPPPAQETEVKDASRLVLEGGAPGQPFARAEAAEALFAAAERARWAEEIRRRLLAQVKPELARLTRTLEKVRAEAARGPDAERHRELGELLVQNAHRIPRGAKVVTLSSYSEAGVVEREVKLDATMSARAQAERHFHQYRRLTRGVAHARERLSTLEQRASALRARADGVARRGEDELLEEMEVLSPRAAGRGRGRGSPRAVPYKEYRSQSGDSILVGKGGPANDTLTFQVARPHDVWFHVRGVPGAHVIVRLARGAALVQETLLDAAHLALHHSDAKGEARGEVSYTPVRLVRRVKGGAPGQVTFTGEKTLMLRVEADRLARLAGVEGAPTVP